MLGPRSRRPAALGVTFLTVVLVAGCSGSGAGSPSAATSSTPSVSASETSVAPSTAASVAPTLAPTPVPSDGSNAGQERTDSFGITQVWVPAGTFTMGTDAEAIAALEKQSPPAWVASEFPSEVPAHKVTLSKGYWIDTTEVS